MAFNARKLTADAAAMQTRRGRPYCSYWLHDHHITTGLIERVRKVESCSAEEHAYPHHSLLTDTQAKRAAMPHLRLARRIAPLRFSF